MDRAVHGHPSIRPCPCPSVSVHGLLDNKQGRLAPKIGILAMSMSPVTLHHFLCLHITALCCYCRGVSALLFLMGCGLPQPQAVSHGI
jgi:hypothetical protein